MLYLSLEAGGGIPCRPYLVTTLLVFTVLVVTYGTVGNFLLMPKTLQSQ